MRPDWDTYFLQVARVVATRGTCDRKQVGTVLVRDRTIISTGYNGSIAGLPHCDDPAVGHLMENGHCVRTIHAEINAVAQAARHGNSTAGCTCYCTASPCWPCFKALVNAGITRIVYEEFYRDARSQEAALALGIEMLHRPLT